MTFSTEFLSERKTQLLLLREEIAGHIKNRNTVDVEEFGRGDAADQSSNITDQHLEDSAYERLSAELKEVDAALARIASGTYGTCEITRGPIEVNRLEALPATRVSLEGQRQIEARRHPRAAFRRSFADS